MAIWLQVQTTQAGESTLQKGGPHLPPYHIIQDYTLLNTSRLCANQSESLTASCTIGPMAARTDCWDGRGLCVSNPPCLLVPSTPWKQWWAQIKHTHTKRLVCNWLGDTTDTDWWSPLLLHLEHNPTTTNVNTVCTVYTKQHHYRASQRKVFIHVAL